MMIEFPDDIYYAYGIGLHKLLTLIGNKKYKYYYDALVFQQRLVENISKARLYGDRDELKADRAEIISNLNKLSLDALNVSFNELCGFASFEKSSRSTAPAIVDTSTSTTLPPGAWTKVHEISKTYHRHVKTISLLTDLKEYEEAEHLYWKTLYYSGYRELWKERDFLSRRLLKLSIQAKDYKTSGLILSKGVAYALVSQRKYSQAEYILKNALKCFKQANAYQEEGIYYNYMADIYEEVGHLDKALNYYKEAMKRSDGLDEYQIYLKRLFLQAKHDEIGSKSRIVALTLLSDQFSLIKNYREPLADLELAKSLYILGDKEEAFYRAKQAYHLLNDVIMMHRNAIKAKEVLSIIEEGKPIELL